jgi:hypothetical protein
MRTPTLTFVFAFAVLLAAANSVLAAPRAVVVAKPRAVVELFTSPNCSSCPPADALFVELAKSSDIITLVMPVDAVDKLDRAGASKFSERQGAYAEVRRRDYSYTPQAMVNGTLEADGADRSDIGDAVAKTASLLSVPVKAAIAGNDIVVSVGAGNATPAMITVMPFLSSRTVAFHREKITYANLVRDIVRVGNWNGKPVRQTLPLQDFAPYDGMVVLLQAGTPERPGAILGAARIPMRAAPAAAERTAHVPQASALIESR